MKAQNEKACEEANLSDDTYRSIILSHNTEFLNCALHFTACLRCMPATSTSLL